MRHVSVIAAAAIAALGLLLFGLAAAITLRRRSTRRYTGCPDDPADLLHRLVRAHGNTAEYVGVLCVLIWIAAQLSASAWLDASIVLAVVSRYCQAAGMLLGPTLDAPPNLLRLIGTGGTYAGGTGLCLAILAALG